MLDTNKELVYSTYLQREYGTKHMTLGAEVSFYNMIKFGQVEEVEKLKNNTSLFKLEGMGHLSDDQLKNATYHSIIGIAMIARFCIEGGLELEEAYTLSDLYIQEIDKAKTEIEVSNVYLKAMLGFAERMKKMRNTASHSLHITKCLDYIYDHLHQDLTVAILAENIDLNPTYLSTLFKKEMGVSVSDYIRTKRLDTAKNMVLYSDFSDIDIANILNFSSHSHFISLFKKQYDMTPKQYKKSYNRSTFTYI